MNFSLIPPKVWREWNALFIGDRPLFDDEQRFTEEQLAEIERQNEKLHAQTVLQEESLKILDEGDFNEYRNMIGEWEPPTGSQSAIIITHIPPFDNPIFGYIINRLYQLVHPPPVRYLVQLTKLRKHKMDIVGETSLAIISSIWIEDSCLRKVIFRQIYCIETLW